MMNKSALILVLLTIFWCPGDAQDVPLPGVTGTLGLDGTVEKFYAVTHSAIVKTADGVRHLVRLTRRTAVHGAAPSSEDGFSRLEEGGAVAVHFVADAAGKTAVEIDRVGDGGLKVAEGVVRGIDRSARNLTIQLSNDSLLTLRLTDRAAHDVGSDVASKTRVIVYYADDGGEHVAHYFKKVS